MKRLENFVRKKEEIELWLNAASPEDREYYYCQQEMNRNVLENYRKVDRIIGKDFTVEQWVSKSMTYSFHHRRRTLKIVGAHSVLPEKVTS